MRAQRKPCPECGETDIFRKTGEICRECKRLIKLARAIDKQQNELESDFIFVRFSDTSHWNEYIKTEGRDYNAKDPRKVLTRLALSVASPVFFYSSGRDDLPILGKNESGSGKQWTMKKETAEAIKELRDMIPELIDSAYSEGKRDGNNLLMRLASGDMAPNDWIKETAEAEEES